MIERYDSCGNCSKWMRSDCPKEEPGRTSSGALTGFKSGPSCDRPACKEFQPDRIRSREAAEQRRKEAQKG